MALAAGRCPPISIVVPSERYIAAAHISMASITPRCGRSAAGRNALGGMELYSNSILSPQQQVLGIPAQLLPVVGVGYGDEVIHPLPDGAAPHGGDAVLGHDVVDVVPAEGNNRALGELGVDSGDVSLFGVGHRLDCDDIPAILGVEGADGIV